MSSKEIESGIKKIFQNTLVELRGKEVDMNKKQGEFESWDSFTHMDLVSKSEEKFGVTLEMSEVVELDTPRKFAKLIEKKMGSR